MPTSLVTTHAAALQLRAQQQRMVQAISAAWQAGEPIAVEAPTGTGKTYAYLLAALERNERFVVSTATRALQDQLVDRDIPALLGHLQLQRRVAVLKGRENYLCLHGLSQAVQSPQPPVQAQALQQVARWAQSTRSGDLAELDDVRALPALLPLVTASHSECLGQRCTQFDACFSNRARSAAARADVLVINHHLFFSELRHRQMLGDAQGFVPLAATVIMDEAHQLQPIGLKVLAKGLNAGDIQDYLQTVRRQTERHARGFAPWPALLAAGNQALAHWLDSSLASMAEDAASENTHADVRSALVALHNRLSALVAALQAVADSAASLAQLVEQGLSLLSRLRQWGSAPAPGLVRWWDTSTMAPLGAGQAQAPSRWLRQGFRESPLWLWQALAQMRPGVQAATWLAPADEAAAHAAAPEESHGQPRRWLFTSATLGQDAELSWFTHGLGLRALPAQAEAASAETDAVSPTRPGLRCLRLEHALDWAVQAALVVPRQLPAADAPHDTRAQALVVWLLPHILALGGRCMLLCTSNAAMQALAVALRRALASQPIDVLAQGEAPKRLLLQRMRAAVEGQRGQVLVGTMALWEGVDLPGNALQLLVIDKLPFPPRHDALHTARASAMQDAGEDGFLAYTLPQTAMQLRQGVGRLLRSFSDRGLVVIADERLHTRNYGAYLQSALPPMPELQEGDVAAYVAALRLAPGWADDAA